LSPQVFSHPAWVRFGKKGVSGSLKIVDDLLSAAKNLQSDDPGTTCQVLLICAVYQNYAGQRFNALKTTRQALDLAQHTSTTTSKRGRVVLLKNLASIIHGEVPTDFGFLFITCLFPCYDLSR
jgi:hypothetical protein